MAAPRPEPAEEAFRRIVSMPKLRSRYPKRTSPSMKNPADMTPRRDKA